MTASTVDEYLAALPADRRAVVDDLRRTITAAAPDATETITQWTPDNSAEAKGRTRRPALLSDPSAVPVKIGGDGIVEILES